MFDFLNPTAFGLDISDSLVKIAQFKINKKRLCLFGFGSSNIAADIVKNGDIKKPEELAKIIKETMAKTKPFQTKCSRVVCSLPESKCFIRVVKLPQMEEGEIAEAVKWEAEEQFPLKTEEMYLDYQILKENKEQGLFISEKKNRKNSSKMEILLTATPKKLVSSYLSVLDMAEIIPIVLEPESIAVSRSLISEKENLGAVMIIDLGKERTNFIIYEEPAIRFTSDISVSGNLLTQAVASEFKVSFNEAEIIKNNCGLDGTKKEGRVMKAISPHLSQLVKKIDQSRNYYYSEHFDSFEKSGTISKIILCGGGANLKGIATFLSLQLKKEIEMGNPWVNFIRPQSKKLPFISYKESLSYVTAFGLALRGIQNY